MREGDALGETDLPTLLANLQPTLDDAHYVFCTVANPAALHLAALATFKEEEGWSLVLEHSVANAHGIAARDLFARITLTVQSSLHAVGLTAAVAGALAQQNISANIVAARHHDHLFVPKADAVQALDVLHELAVSSAKE